MNKPFVKKFDAEGICTNEIESSYLSRHPNRQQRRQHLNEPPFYGESKNVHLTVYGSPQKKFYRRKQYIFDKQGRITKTILHYLSAN